MTILRQQLSEGGAPNPTSFRRFTIAAATALLAATLLGCGWETGDSQTASVDPSTFPEVVARVAGVEITREELAKRVALETRLSAAQPTFDVYFRTLDEMIGSELIYQESLRQGFGLSEEELSRRIATIRSRFASGAQYQEALAAQGLTPEQARENLSRDLAVKRFLQERLEGDIKVEEEEVRQYYEENRENIRAGDRLRLRHILIRTQANATRSQIEKARERAELLRKQIELGSDFAVLAAQYSEDPVSAAAGGDLSWITRGDTAPPFERAAYSLEVGQVSDVVRSPYGFHVIELLERKPGAPLSFAEARDAIAAYLRERKIAEKIGKEAFRLREQAEVEIYLEATGKAFAGPKHNDTTG